jgi:thymidylate synthase
MPYSGSFKLVFIIIIRAYLIGYIFYIIDCHIYQDIFDKIDIMYYRLSYVFEIVLPLKTHILYIDIIKYIL